MPSVYQIVTERIIAELQKGTAPWHRPWKSTELPKNLVSGKQYRGINTWLLLSAAYDSPYWLTFKQAKDLGGSVRKGEHGTPIVFWSVNNKQVENPDSHEIENERHFVCRYFVVFNCRQCENLPALPDETLPEIEPIEAAEQIVAGYHDKPSIEHRGDRAYYSPVSDIVTLPNRNTFDSPECYYATAFHELTHSTGHEKRLDRKLDCNFGSEKYSKEELVAELGSAFLSGQCGIVDRIVDNSAAYIQSWIAALQNDHKLIIIASAQAQKAVDYIAAGKEQSHDQQADAAEPVAA